MSQFNDVQENLFRRLKIDFILPKIRNTGSESYTITDLEDTVSRWIKAAQVLEESGMDPEQAWSFGNFWNITESELHEVLTQFKHEHSPSIQEIGVSLEEND